MRRRILMLLMWMPMLAMAQQVVIVNVSPLSGEGSNERMGVVLQKDGDNEAFHSLMMELKNHSDKVGATRNQADRKKNEARTGTADDVLNDALAQLDDLKKKGLLSEADYRKMKDQMSAQVSADKKRDAEAQAKVAAMAASPGSSDPSALKERIRSYCVGKRFYWKAEKRHDMVVISDKKADDKTYYGLMDAATGRVLIEPDRFDAVSAHKEHGYFTKDGYSIAGLEGKSVLINKSGRIILNGGYDNLSFYDDCRILKARKGSKVGIIDYQGNVLEPFVHNSYQSESLAKAANRIFNERGGVKVEIW
ncbi:MAG: hypothetical protein IJD32_08435 [Bacteroidaceae bacterium]|nr:hypothetical protein [Bacteroidaceae bacterium]